jgi:CheY-like chemotaxis protein
MVDAPDGAAGWIAIVAEDSSSRGDKDHHDDACGEPVVRLLLVDDEADILETVHDLLEFAVPEVEVVMARNGLLALEAMRHGSFDAVLTDYRMPGMDGAELVQAIQKEWPGTPLLMFTAYVDQHLLKDLHARLPGLEIIPKPVDIAAFVPRIRDLVHERKRG